MKHTTADWFEMAGHDAGEAMLNKLLHCPSQGTALPFVIELLGKVGEVRSEEDRRAMAGGAAVALVDVLLVGLDAIRKRSAL